MTLKRKYRHAFLLAALCLIPFASWYLFGPEVRTSMPAFREPHVATECQPVMPDKCGTSWQVAYCSFHNRTLHSPSTVKFLSYYCNQRACGGVGNRIQGIVSIFYLAILINRAFIVHWGGPGSLQKYLEPNKINWTVSGDFIRQFNKTYWGGWGPPEGYSRSRIESPQQFESWISEIDAEPHLSPLQAIGTVWYFAEQLRSNPHFRERALELEIPSSPWRLLGCAFHFLFKKTKAMATALDEARFSLHRSLPRLGIHIRTSDHHFGDPNEMSYRSHNTSSFFTCALRQTALIRECVKPSIKKLSWFLAADDITVKNMARKNYPREIISLNFTPKHTEYSWGGEVLRDVLLDAFLLSESHFLLITSKSTLSRVSAAIGYHDDYTIADGEQCLVNETSLLKIVSLALKDI